MPYGLLQASLEAVKNLFKRPATVLYPIEHVAIPDKFRGVPILQPDMCRLCSRCERACPTNAIEIKKTGKKSGTFIIDVGKCCYCGECEQDCSFGAIELSSKWQTASMSKEHLRMSYQIKPEEDEE